jgi:acetylornithine/N-succinyldiaminopimelate aminotransferase
MGGKLDDIIAQDKEYLFQNYSRLPVSFTHGKGEFLFDQDGKSYIDFFAGIAVSSLGYAHPALTQRLHDQVDKVLHSSNWYYNTEQIEAAKLLSDFAFKGRTLFCNSGTEANEAALKLARKYGTGISAQKTQIISFSGSFHGRTYGSLSVTGNEKIKNGFGELLQGITILPYNQSETLKDAMSDSVCAVILEVIQGEGGIIVADKTFIETIISECRTHKALLIIDEIQTGVGRTGKPFGFQHYDISPDIITLAKGLAGGVPIGALHAKEELYSLFNAGAHGTTFGGNHLACAAAAATLHEVFKSPVLQNVKTISALFFKRLTALKNKIPAIKEVRGMGLHIGIELSIPGAAIVKKALDAGLLINCTHDTVLRIMPPLVISEKAVQEGLDIFETIFSKEA